MIKYRNNNTNQWVDLSNLPKMNNGKNIDWKNSVGKSVNFQYDNIMGTINIVGHKIVKTENNQKMIMVAITIDKYVPEPIYIYANVLRYCEIRHLVHNKIADVVPHIMQYLANKQDGYKYAWQSDKYVETICPTCGHRELKHIGGLCRNGFFCPACSDGISIPNKIMYNVLSQVGIPFKREVGRADFKWMKKYFYDFYFQTPDGTNVLIEMDGGLHSRIEEQKDRDEIKNQLAAAHNFQLIRIDCDYRNAREKVIDYIKENIVNSELPLLLNLEVVDWKQCASTIKNNVMIQICSLWENDGWSSGDIVRFLQLHRTTVCTYLKRGYQLGLCPSYSTEESLRRRKRYKMIENNIEVVKDGDQ